MSDLRDSTAQLSRTLVDIQYETDNKHRLADSLQLEVHAASKYNRRVEEEIRRLKEECELILLNCDEQSRLLKMELSHLQSSHLSNKKKNAALPSSSQGIPIHPFH